MSRKTSPRFLELSPQGGSERLPYLLPDGAGLAPTSQEQKKLLRKESAQPQDVLPVTPTLPRIISLSFLDSN